MALKIDNATAVYAIMIALFAAGMWAILAYGSTLRAQPDLAGEWELVPEAGSDQSSRQAERVTIEQSGRFVRLQSRAKNSSIGTLAMKILPPDEARPTMPEDPVVLTADGERKAAFTPVEGSNSYRVQLPDGATYRAQLVAPAHARPTAAAKPPATAPLTAPMTPHAP